MSINANLHPRSLHREGYPFKQLAEALPALSPFLCIGKHGKTTIDFANPTAVKTLNAALLKFYFNLQWDIPDGNLCPPIPGRADYIHYAADLICGKHPLKLIKGSHIKALDIGTGANLIYPLLGHAIYDWQWVGADISLQSIKSANSILSANPSLEKHISLRHQADNTHYFKNIIQPGEFYHLSVCNPPFFESSDQASKATARKLKGLKIWDKSLPRNNFSGQDNELWCEGGELRFVTGMINESKEFAKQVAWFTCLISNQDNLSPLLNILKKHAIKQHKIIDMAQGNKVSRILAWQC